MEKKRLRFTKIDAFATERSDGNPAGVIWLDSLEDITPDEMLQIAREMKNYVSEVGYISPLDDGRFAVKYYSSEREVNFCGHATIAMMHELFSTHGTLKNRTWVTIVTNDGELIVENRLNSDGAVYIMAPSPKEQGKVPCREDIAIHLNTKVDNLSDHLPIGNINGGLRTLLVPIKSFEAVIHMKPELEKLNRFCQSCDIDIVEIFTDEVAGEQSDYRVRVFPATFGYLEDPATGSGNSALGYYLIQNKLWNKETFIIEQNDQMEKFNIIKLQKKTDDKGRERIIFGGGAIKRIDGYYIL